MLSATEKAPDQHVWSLAGWLPVLVALSAIALLHRATLASLVSVWSQSVTFTHCYLIVPICLWLLWERRADLKQAPRSVSPIGFVAVAVLTIAWVIATAARIQVAQQAAVVLLVPATALALLGRKATKSIAFPLGYLLFAVPFGEWAMGPLMSFTADFAVAGLRASGIPVLHEGYYFSIPSGDFEVAKGCSGIRYLIACLAVGVLYAHFAYRSWPKRLAFVALSLVVPIVGNGVRAYLIVMIAHLTEMRYATGVDHLIYGFIFFGVIVAALLWVGNLFADRREAPARVGAAVAGNPPGMLAVASAAVLVVGITALGPVVSQAEQTLERDQTAEMNLPRLAGSWGGPDHAAGAWHKSGDPGVVAVEGRYRGPAGEVDVSLFTTARTSEAETVGLAERLVDRARWQVLAAGTARARSGQDDFGVQETVLKKSAGGHAVVWSWYVVDGTPVASDLLAKLFEIRGALGARRAATTLVAVSSGALDLDVARETVRRFVADAHEEIDACVGAHNGRCVAPGAGGSHAEKQ